LIEELEKKIGKLEFIEVRLLGEKKPGDFYLYLKEGKGKGKDRLIASWTIDEGDFDIVCVHQFATGKDGKEVFERALENLKKSLPEDFEVKSDMNSEKACVTIKIKGSEKNKEQAMQTIKEWVKALKEELGKKE
jgi:hypothetical protein